MTNPAEQIEELEQPDLSEAGMETPPVDDAPPVRRARGRPRKDGSSGPAKESVSGTGAKRGRPAKTAAKRVYSQDDVTLLGNQLVGIHRMASFMTQLPEVTILEPEGEAMAKAIITMADQYDLELDGKTGAALQLFATAAMIYAPRIIAIRRRLQKEAPIDVGGEMQVQ